MKSLATTALCLMAGVMPMHAEEDKPTVHLNLQTRASYVNERIGSEVQHDASGMKGDYLFLSLYGNINDRLSYNWRQRVNSKITRNDIFEATDWMYIDYKLTKNWTVSAGKQVIMVGSWEYDRNPIASTLRQNTGTTWHPSSSVQASHTPQRAATTASLPRLRRVCTTSRRITTSWDTAFTGLASTAF